MLSLPNTLTSISNYTLQNACSLNRLILPDSITSMGLYYFDNCYGLDTLIFQRKLTTITRAMSCYSLTKLVFPENLTTTIARCFEGCRSLRYLKFPSTFKTIAERTFKNCTAMRLYDFSDHTTIPTLGATTVFEGIHADCKIVVPDNLYDDWIIATNWGDYSSYIIKKSDYDIL